MKISRLALVLLAATSVASCVSEPDFGFAQFSINAGPDLTVAQGTLVGPSILVTITRADGYTEGIDFTTSGLPTGVTVGSPFSVTGNGVTLPVSVGPDVVAGSYTLRVRGQQNKFYGEDEVVLTVTQVLHFSLGVASPALSIAQGASSPTQLININRVVTYLGPVTFSAATPPGVTASFEPESPQSFFSNVMTLTVASTAGTGTFPVTVTGVGSGGAGSAQVSFNLTITPAPVAGNFTLSAASPVNVVQGGSLPVTVTIDHTGGNTSNVALTATFNDVGAPPAGLTLSFLPTSTTLGSSQLTISTAPNTLAGSYPFVIRGNAAGLAEQTTNLIINVTAPAPVNVTVTFASCTAGNKPAWFAYRDGTTGAWTAVTGVGDVYTFPIAQAKGSFAYVTIPFGTARTFVQHKTQAELSAGTINPCVTATPAGSALQGTLINLPAASEALIDFGGASALVSANGNFQLNNTPAGTFDLIGFARNPTTRVASRGFIQRSITPPAGTFSVTVDFAHPSRSDNAAAGTGTLTGLTGSETELYSNMTYYTGGAACRASLLYASVDSPAGFNFYGIPASLRVPATDMHSLQLTVIDGAGSSRTLTEAFVDVAARAAAPFLLPAPIVTAVASNAGGPYKRPSVAVTGLPAEYNVSHTLFYIDNGGSGEQGTIVATPGWVAGSSTTLELPNFSGVGVFQDAWAPAASDVLNWNFRSVGGAGVNTCVAGQRGVATARTGTL